MSIDKRFEGDLDGTSKGHMLATSGSTPESAAYVAIEKVVGTLRGRRGTFALQHAGAMSSGGSTLRIDVVPDSGMGELEGLTGTMSIEVVDGEHRYEFDYALP